MRGSQYGTPWVDDGATPESREKAEHFLKVGVDIYGTPVERYLRDVRRIDAPYPSDFKYVEDARTGEGALLVPLYVEERVVAVQLIFLDREGRKSTVAPVKQRFALEHAPDATFVMPYEGDSTDVVFCEGVEDALTVYRYGALRCRVLGLPGIGGLRHQKFPEATKVIVVADGDPPGSKGAKLLQDGLDALLLQKCDVWVTKTPPEGCDANFFLVSHGVDALKAFLASAEPATYSEILRLASLDLLAYGKERLQAAKDLGITVGILDQIVERERRKRASKAKADEDWISVDDTRFWQEEVDGVELLDDLVMTLRSFVIMTKQAAWAVALWVLFTWCFEAAHCALKLWIKSPEKRSGKTRLVEVLSYLVYRALTASGMTVSAFYRLIEMKGHPSVLMDEFDTWASESPEFRGILNAGFDKKNAVRWVCVGDDHTPTPFSLWCPQVIAGIGNIADTVADRCLKIELKRKLRSETVIKLRRRGTGALDDLARKCARWANDNIKDLMTAEPEVPDSINDRAADGWEILLAIAEQIGGPWPQRARQAAIKLSGGEYSIDDESISAQLFHDIRAVLKEHSSVGDKIPSSSLVGWLVALEDRPWVEFKRGQPMTQHQLARQLRKFEIRPHSAGEKARWYSRPELISVLDRWHPEQPKTATSGVAPNGHDTSSPGDSDFQTVQPSEAAEILGCDANFKPSGEGQPDGLKKLQNPSETAPSDGWTVSNPENPRGVHESPANGLDDNRENGASPDPQPTSVADEARTLKEQNPSWSIKRIAAELGQPERRIERYFENI